MSEYSYSAFVRETVREAIVRSVSEVRPGLSPEDRETEVSLLMNDLTEDESAAILEQEIGL